MRTISDNQKMVAKAFKNCNDTFYVLTALFDEKKYLWVLKATNIEDSEDYLEEKMKIETFLKLFNIRDIPPIRARKSCFFFRDVFGKWVKELLDELEIIQDPK